MEKLNPQNLMDLVAQLEHDARVIKHLWRSRQMEFKETQGYNPQAMSQLERILEGLDLQQERAISQPHRGQVVRGEPQCLDAVTSIEAEAIIQDVEKTYHTTKVLERLSKLEKQNHRITIIGSMFLAILALVLVTLAVRWAQSNLVFKISLIPATQEDVSKSKKADLERNEKKVSNINPNPKNPGTVETTVAVSHPEAGTKVIYVGSITSNKYHYPECKWAQKIKPEKLITFGSVAEAKKAGYKPCPTCR